MPKNNPAAKNEMVTPKVKGSWWNRDMSMLTTLVPLKYLPVDWIDVPARTQVDVSPKIDIESLPAVSPLYDGWTLETFYYFVPYRLYMPTLRINNVEDVGDIDAEKFPLIRITSVSGPDDGLASNFRRVPYVAVGSLLHRLGYMRGDYYSMRSFHDGGEFFDIGMPLDDASIKLVTELNFVPFLAYLDTWLYGQFNKQDKLIPVEYTDMGDAVGSIYDVSQIKRNLGFVNYDVLKAVIPNVAYGKNAGYSQSIPISIYRGEVENVFRFGKEYSTDGNLRTRLVPGYSLFDVAIFDASSGDSYRSSFDVVQSVISNTGLLPVTYFGDRFTSWFNADSVNKLNQYRVTAGDTLLTLRCKDDNMMLDLIAMVSGNDYRSYLKFVFGTELDLCDHPILVGKDSVSFGFIDVLNQSANVSTDGDVSTDKVSQALAYTAGKARSKNNNVRDINFKTREPGLFMVFASLRPTVRYYQGLDSFLTKTEYSEVWHPQYSSQGFVNPRMSERFSFYVGPQKGVLLYPSTALGYNPDDKALDVYVPFGWEYQTGVRKLGGAMVMPRYKTWSLARDFSLVRGYESEVDDLSLFSQFAKSSYGNRANFDFNFVDTSPEAQNFIMNFSAKVRCFQPMSKVLVRNSI